MTEGRVFPITEIELLAKSTGRVSHGKNGLKGLLFGSIAGGIAAFSGAALSGDARLIYAAAGKGEKGKI